METTGRHCLSKKNQRWWYIAPTYKQSEEGYRKFIEIYPKSLIIPYKAPLRIKFPMTGSEVEFRSTVNNAYEHWRAAGLNGAVFDEAGSVPEEAVLTLQPMLTDDPNSILALVGSPRGRNHFYKYWRLGHDRNSGWWSNPMPWPSILRPSFDRGEWERMKRDYPEMWFRQEFLAEFLSNVLGAFKRPVDADFEYASFNELARLSKEGRLSIGVDFARTTDFTVIAVMDGSGRVVYLERFQLKPWAYVAARCKAVWNQCGRCMMAIDVTGLGDVVHEMLITCGIAAQSIIPYMFTNESKAELVVNGQKLNEKDEIRIPKSDRYACSEFDAYEVAVNSNGKFKFNAPSGKHDDIVVAVLLAAWLREGQDKFKIGAFKFYEPAA